MGWVHYGLSAFIVLGITDDDLRETAYEILLACAGASGYVFTILLELYAF